MLELFFAIVISLIVLLIEILVNEQGPLFIKIDVPVSKRLRATRMKLSWSWRPDDNQPTSLPIVQHRIKRAVLANLRTVTPIFGDSPHVTGHWTGRGKHLYPE
jgi:hypothetical protein